MSELDLRCYFVTGAVNANAHTHAKLVARAAAAARGGAGVVQVRSKPISARDLFALGRDIATAVAAANSSTRVLIDDRVDVALSLRHAGLPVHGVHLGQDDLDPRHARQLLGPDAIIGLTTGTLELIHESNELAEAIDYVGCGPFRATPTKDSGRTPLGLEGYPPITAASRLPVVAIGDVTVNDVADLAATGVAGVAIVRALMNAKDPAGYATAVVEGFA